MKQGGRQTALGFTIVETMIVLAVTGAIFASAITLISGRQAKTEFMQSINEVVTQVQQSISQVATGYYPDINNVGCSGAGSLSIVPSGTTPQGSNAGCLFLGSLLHFGVTGGPNEQFVSYTLAGCQYKNCSLLDKTEATTLAEARSLVIAPEASHTSVPNATTRNDLLNGLSLSGISYVKASDGSTHKTRAIGFLQSLGSYSGCGGLCGGTQQASLVAVTANGADIAANVSGATMATYMDNPNNIVPATSAQICFTSGTTSQSGLLSIGGNGRQLAVTLQIKNTTDCS